MPVHDDYPRITPYELLLPEEDFADRRFPLIQKEAEERGQDLVDPQLFALLSESGAVLRDLRGEEDDPRRIHQFGALLFHAFHSWTQDLPLYLLTTEVMRYLADTGPEHGAWTPVLPASAGYAQLPQHLFWVPGDRDAPAESLDGFFWSAPEGGDLSLLIVMGMRKDRPGLSVVPLPPLPLESAAEWASMDVRPRGKDFQSSLPGADLDHLYALEAGAEAVKLAMRVFWYLDVFHGSRTAVVPEEIPDDGPRPSRLDFRRIDLGDR